jgi:hypothetical protein
MSERFSRSDRSFPKRGRPHRIKLIGYIDYKDWHIEYDYCEITNEYLVIITPPNLFPIKPFEITLSDEVVRDRGVENTIASLVVALETSLKEEIEMISKYFNISPNSVTQQQIVAFRELKRREII